eukprot:TRINITY_DN3658_c0_g1_i3.p1 TRINITY_DN3658_c0_g1~~TRINITY_DN3658_c0_g1_i3.p1  ORF type:complete len:259 (+),score=65.69 TRINITY_DN3658_c0_g1_i3:93-779(+)
MALSGANVAMMNFIKQNVPNFKYTLEEFNELRLKVARENPKIKHDWTAIRIRALEIALEESGYGPEETSRLAQEGFEAWIKGRHQSVQYFEDSLPVLHKIKERRLVVGALTNGNANVYELGLRHLFEFKLNPMEVGVAKPEREFFERVLVETKVEACEVLHVGDNPVDDVWGAKRVGFRAAWINRKGEQWPQNLVEGNNHHHGPDLIANSLWEVLEWLEKETEIHGRE